jgi:pilus assembly protein FimV
LDVALEAIPSEEVIYNRLEQAFDAFPSEEVIHNRLEEAFAAFPKSGDVTDRINEALKSIPSEDVIQDRLEKALAAFPKPEEVADQINDAMKALPTREEIEHRLEKVLDAFPEEEDINGRLNQAISQIPDRQAILDHIDESVKIMPTAEDVLSRLDGRFQSIMPTRGEIQQSLSAMMESKVDHAMKQVDLPGLVRSAAPDADQFLEEIRLALPDRARFQDTIAQGINLAIENALPERMWLESLSKGLFDERTRGLLPSKDEVAGILREEIRYKLLETVERIVRAQLERISTELNV